jgi:hypothetical protein
MSLPSPSKQQEAQANRAFAEADKKYKSESKLLQDLIAQVYRDVTSVQKLTTMKRALKLQGLAACMHECSVKMSRIQQAL